MTFVSPKIDLLFSVPIEDSEKIPWNFTENYLWPVADSLFQISQKTAVQMTEYFDVRKQNFGLVRAVFVNSSTLTTPL